LSLQYRRRLPRVKESEWTLGDLLGGCKKLLGAIEIQRITPGADPTVDGSTFAAIAPEIGPLLEEAGTLAFIRNQVGCHFNLSGGDVPNDDIRNFAQSVVKIVKAVTCPDCGDIPDRKDGTCYRCGCKRTRMTPLEYDK